MTVEGIDCAGMRGGLRGNHATLKRQHNVRTVCFLRDTETDRQKRRDIPFSFPIYKISYEATLT